MNRFRTHLMAGCALGALIAVSAPAAAQTWVGGTTITTPASQAGNFDWDNDANWNPAAAPNSAGATANFGNTGGTNVVFSAPSTTVGTINFAANAQAYTFTLVTDPAFNPNGQTISLGGIANNSGTTQTFNINPATASGSTLTNTLMFTGGTITGPVTINTVPSSGISITPQPSNSLLTFVNSASAGTAATTINNNGTTEFHNKSSAGSAVINNLNPPSANGGGLNFFESATAGNATITNASGITINFANSSTAGSAAITNNGQINFNDMTSAAQATVTSAGIINFNSSSQAGSANINSSSSVTFANKSSAGGAHIVSSGGLFFQDSSSAGSATISSSGSLAFQGTATAGTANITLSKGTFANFFDTTTGGQATITNQAGAELFFLDSSHLGNANIVNTGALEAGFTGNTTFANSSADNAKITTMGGGVTAFFGQSTGGTATFATGKSGMTVFAGSATAASATFNTQNGGGVLFFESASGGNATFNTDAGGLADFSQLLTGGTTAGSINGAGNYALGSKTLTIGGANADSSVSGVISDRGGSGTGSGGALVKLGTGTLALSGANAYTGGTTLSGGTLQVGNNSALGAGGLAIANGTTLRAGADGLDVGNAITIGGAGTIDTNGNGLALSGVIGDGSTPGSLVKLGTGTLSLSGANTYTGGTTLAGGTLQVGNNNALGTLALVIGNGTTVQAGATGLRLANAIFVDGTGTIDTNGNSLTLSNIIANDVGAGALVKAGAGTLTLNGINTFTGVTTVNGGTLQVGDASTPTASLAGPVTVNGGTLSGHGTILGSVTNSGGVVAPGGTIGTLTVNSFTQGPSGTFQIEVSPSTASQLKVNGAANLNGNLALVYDPGTYSAKTYPILTASSVSGNFATTTGTPPAGVTQSVKTTPTEVDLVLAGASTVGSGTGGTGGTGAGGGEVIVVAPTNATLPTAVATVTIDNARNFGNTLLDHLGQVHSGGADVAHTALGVTAPQQIAFAGGDEALSGLIAALPDAAARFGGWFRAAGNFSAVSHNSAAPGFDSNSGGFLAGLDRPVTDNIVLGAAAGYAHTNVNEHSDSTSSVDTPLVMLYGSYTMGDLFTDALVGYGHDDFDNRRLTPVGTATSNHDGNEVTAAVKESYRILSGKYVFTPNAGLQYTHLSESGFGETGASGFDLATAGSDTDSLRPFIGASAARNFETDDGTRLTPELSANYSHDLLNTGRTINVTTASGSAFTVAGVSPSRDQVTLGAGLTVQANERLDLFADYDVAPRTGNQTSQTISAGLRYRF